MNPREPSRAEVELWLQAVRHDLDLLQGRLSPLLEEQRRLEARQALLKDLLSSFVEPGEESLHEAPRPWGLSVQPTGSIGEYVRDRAEEILREVGGPLHINEIHTRFVKRGYHVPGAGKPVNLIVHLRKAPGIASPARGMYGLVEDVGQVRRTRAKRTRRKSKARRPGRTPEVK